MTKRQYRIETHPKINMDSFETTALWWYLKMAILNEGVRTLLDVVHSLPWGRRGARAECPGPRLFNATESEEVI